MKANKYGAASDVSGYLSHAKDLYSFATGSPGSYQDLKDPCLAQHGELYKSTGGDVPLLASLSSATAPFSWPGAASCTSWSATGRASCAPRTATVTMAGRLRAATAHAGCHRLASLWLCVVG